MKKSTARLQVVPEKAPYDENLRLWLVNYLKETGLSTTEFARLCGGSRAFYDDYIKCKYFGVPDPKNNNRIRVTENSKFEPMIRAFRARVEGPNAVAGQKSDFIKNTGWNQLRTAIETAIAENSITMVTAVFGDGKTRCVNEFMFKKLKQPFVLILCSPNITVRYFLQKIAGQLGLDKPSHTIPQLEDDIVEHLKHHPRVLVIDQANYLPPKALGSIVYIWEASRAPVTLVGTPTLRTNFLSPKMTCDERGQMASRVAMEYVMTGLDLGTVKGICQRALGETVATPQVVKRIWESIGGKVDKDGNDLMVANFRALEFRLRRLNKLMQVNEVSSISDEMLVKCELMMLHKAA